ncbi:m74 protein [Murid betaherpesvirus 1]|nr:m74 protein [Murid betaherpesvirus 1]
MNPLLLMTIVMASSVAAAIEIVMRKTFAYNPINSSYIEMTEDDYDNGAYDIIDATEPPGGVQVGSSLVDNPPPDKEPDAEEKEDTKAKNYLTFAVKSVKFSKTWIRRKNRRPNNVFPIWYLIEGTEVENIKPYAGQYVHATFAPDKKNNKTTKTGTVNVSGAPCGPISSLSCQKSMLKDLINPTKSEITSKYFKKCVAIFAAPIMYNLPRWKIELKTPDRHVLVTDSFTVTTLAVATLISRYSRGKIVQCAKSFVPLYAIQHSIFNVTTSKSNIRRFFNTFHTLKSQVPVTATTLAPRRRSARLVVGGVSSPPIPNNRYPIQSFYDFSTFMYASLYHSSRCDLKKTFVNRTVLTNGTVLTVSGPLNVTTLYKPDAKKKPEIKDDKINLEDIATLDDVLMDYLDTLTLTASPKNTISQKLPQHVPSAPHKRRTGLISFSRI